MSCWDLPLRLPNRWRVKAITLTPNERGIFAASAHQLIYDEAEGAPIRPEQLLNARRFDDRRMDDLWTIYNICQENIIKVGVRGCKQDDFGRYRRVTTRPVKALDRSVKLNQALWFLTDKMRELKMSHNN